MCDSFIIDKVCVLGEGGGYSVCSAIRLNSNCIMETQIIFIVFQEEYF